ncbi:MAG: hypothetical protein LBI53_08125 [Candidatus Peribacteria bacterium]|jgi:hypothetical protein|nr:hypothetical protein [Candidatus Peribacteria bacterium]
MNKVGTPLIIVEESNGYKYALIGEVEAMDHFKTIEQQIQQFLEKENSNQTP